MKKRGLFKRSLFALLAAVLVLSAAACGGASSYHQKNTDDSVMSAENGADLRPETLDTTTKDEGELVLPESGERKLMRSAELSIETYSFDDFAAKIKKEVEAAGGYIENSSVEGSKEDSSRWGKYTVRVPDKDLDAFLEAIKGDDNVTRQNMSEEDVTLEYHDTENRITAIRTEQDTLLKMLKQAENLEDVLAIQSRLTDLRVELENYESHKRYMDNRIDYALVTIYVEEVRSFTSAPEYTYKEEIRRRFREGTEDFVRFFRDLSFALAGNLFFILLLILIVLIIVLIVRNASKRSDARRKKRAEEAAAKGFGPPYRQPQQPQGVRPPPPVTPQAQQPQAKKGPDPLQKKVHRTEAGDAGEKKNKPD